MVVASHPQCAMPSPTELQVDVTVDTEVTLPPVVTVDAITSLARHVLSSGGRSGAWQFGVQFVNDLTMQRAHADFMGIDTATDIMTFPYEDVGFDLVPEGEEMIAEQGGDLMISVDRATEHAREAGWNTDQELFFLVCHGVLHVLGWDDASDDDRARMLERQDELLASWQLTNQAGSSRPR